MRQKERKERELEEKLCPGYALFLLWPVVASENNIFIWDFLSFYGSKDCLKLECDQWPGMIHKLRYTQTTLSDSAAWSCFEKARYFRSSKIHKKLGFQPNAKIFAAFSLIPYRDCTK